MSLDVTLQLADPAATEALGRKLAQMLRPGDVIALDGPLGSGKTALARATIRELTDPDEEVPSPTFTLVQHYECAQGPLYHFDLYRLEGPDQAVELGIDDAFADGISLVEWPERLGGYLPRRHLRITLAPGPHIDSRIAKITGGQEWKVRWG